MSKPLVSYPVICARCVRLWNQGITNFARIAAIVGQNVSKEDVETYLSTRPGYPNSLKPNDKPKDAKRRKTRIKLDDRIGLSVRQTMAARRGAVTLPSLPDAWK